MVAQVVSAPLPLTINQLSVRNVYACSYKHLTTTEFMVLRTRVFNSAYQSLVRSWRSPILPAPNHSDLSGPLRFSTMATEFKVKDVSSLASIKPGKLLEVELEGLPETKVLLLNTKGTVHAVGPKCTHYGAPLAKGVLTSEGRLTCPWHGACFNVSTGDVEDAPALDPIATFGVEEKNGAIYIKGDEASIKAGRKTVNVECAGPSGQEKVVVIGGYVSIRRESTGLFDLPMLICTVDRAGPTSLKLFDGTSFQGQLL